MTLLLSSKIKEFKENRYKDTLISLILIYNFMTFFQNTLKMSLKHSKSKSMMNNYSHKLTSKPSLWALEWEANPDLHLETDKMCLKQSKIYHFVGLVSIVTLSVLSA